MYLFSHNWRGLVLQEVWKGNRFSPTKLSENPPHADRVEKSDISKDEGGDERGFATVSALEMRPRGDKRFSGCPFIHSSLYLSIYPFIHPSIYLSIQPAMHHFILVGAREPQARGCTWPLESRKVKELLLP